MIEIFGQDIARLLNEAVGTNFPPLTLVKVTAGARTAGSLTGGTNPTTVSHSGRGIRDSLKRLRPDTIVADAKAVILIIGDSLPSGVVPETGDRITIEGETFSIVSIDRDPAAATYECQVT